MLASLETLQLTGRQSLIILVTIGVGRLRSSGLSAMIVQKDNNVGLLFVFVLNIGRFGLDGNYRLFCPRL